MPRDPDDLRGPWWPLGVAFLTLCALLVVAWWVNGHP